MAKEVSSRRPKTQPQRGVESDSWLDPITAGAYTGKHEQTIRKACRLREIAHSRKGRYGHIRIRRSSLDAWMKGNEVTVARWHS